MSHESTSPDQSHQDKLLIAVTRVLDLLQRREDGLPIDLQDVASTERLIYEIDMDEHA